MKSKFDKSEFAACYPVAFMMRQKRSDWWFRIHSLPESKRYAESKAEWNILLERHRKLADAILIPGSSCRVSYAQFSGFPFPKRKLPKLNWKPFRSIGSNDDALDSWMALATWEFDEFEPWIRKKSSDEIAFIGFHSMESDSIYMPYDGGADVFSLDPDFMGRIRNRFREWKSPLKSGL